MVDRGRGLSPVPIGPVYEPGTLWIRKPIKRDQATIGLFATPSTCFNANNPIDYSMLSKTSVHHFNGNNVSSRNPSLVYVFMRRTFLCVVALEESQKSSSCLPREEVLSRLWRVPVLVAYFYSPPFHRSSWVPPAESSSGVQLWPFLTLVTPTSLATNKLKDRTKKNKYKNDFFS